MANDCRECAAGRPHCHGTLIRHHSGHCECTDPECDEVLLHSLIVDCDALGCACTDSGDERALAI